MDGGFLPSPKIIGYHLGDSFTQMEEEYVAICCRWDGILYRFDPPCFFMIIY
jgi:hypothetical protein